MGGRSESRPEFSHGGVVGDENLTVEQMQILLPGRRIHRASLLWWPDEDDPAWRLSVAG
jgi:hypothetical protein